MTARRRSDVETGMLLMAVAMLALPCIDAIAKSMAGRVPSAEIALARFVMQTAILLPFAIGRGMAASGRVLAAHVMRGALIAAATLLFFTALQYLPLADAIAIFFVEPLLLTLLSPFFLGEKVGWRRLTAVAAGFAGAMMIIRPSFEEAGWPALLPLAAALCFAFYLVLTRRLARTGDPVVMQAHAGIFGGLTAGLALAAGAMTGAFPDVLVPVLPDLTDLLLLTVLGIIATGGHMLVVHAFKRADAGLLAPFQYLEIISATALGLLIFGDFPDPLTWAGIAVIVGSGLYVFHRERVAQTLSSTP
ncbi:MAG: DMT family transporter [Minwuia sp.]|uniref:DMT family transporter n=1 Tax=Minwuia sp. TaxID=2493630 RepID=UPI003A864547